MPVDQVGQALDLVSRYGLALVGVVVLSGVVIWLFKALRDSWALQLKAERDKTAYVEQLRLEERSGRLAAEGRLTSNAAALQDAISVFAAAQQLLEKLVEHSDSRQRTKA